MTEFVKFFGLVVPDDPNKFRITSVSLTVFLPRSEVRFSISFLFYFRASSFLPCFLRHGFCNVKEGINTAFPVMHEFIQGGEGGGLTRKLHEKYKTIREWVPSVLLFGSLWAVGPEELG
jgi:hypothetical protein